MKNIIFLDIDGVLNCQLHFQSKMFTDYIAQPEKLKSEHYKSQLCPDRIKMLNELCASTDTAIVISSTWRMGKTVEELQATLNASGATFTIIGKTDHLGYERGIEISKWLKDNCMALFNVQYYDFYRYAIIDDDSDMLLNQQFHFFQTDSYCGLTYNTCYKIKRFFTKKTFDF